MPFRHSQSPLLKKVSFWRMLIHLPSTIKLSWRLFKDHRVPLFGKIVLLLALAYLIWPLDLIPDFAIPVVGQIDDLAVLLAGLRFFLHQTPQPVLEEHLAQMS